MVYHFIGCSIFPVDEATNVLLAPDWYPILGFFIAGFSVFVFVKWSNRASKTSWLKSAKEKRAYKNLSDVEKWELEKNAHKVVSEEKLHAAIEIFRETGQTSCSILERKMGIDFSTAREIMDELERRNYIEKRKSQVPYKEQEPCATSDIYYKYGGIDAELLTVDLMEGHQFEYWCANLLKKNGFIDVVVTPGSGDQGVDITAKKDGIHYAIQCKCYSSDLGNKPVQEVYAGKEMYCCQVGVVMTNRYFTDGAKALAKQTRVLLWDRDKLQEMIDHAKSVE